MPDKWEYPWYAAWDLAFHCVPLALVDSDFAKEQLLLMLREWYMHPNGQLPAYEWAFGDVNPPVHAWAAWRVYKIDKKRRGVGDRVFLERVFQKLLLNFTWWVNRKDAEGSNVFQGGFLGLDNIGVFDRSAPLPTGGHIEQSDGTSWMAMYSLNLLAIAMELAVRTRPTKTWPASSGSTSSTSPTRWTPAADEDIEIWDDEDGFFYDMLHLPDGEPVPDEGALDGGPDSAVCRGDAGAELLDVCPGSNAGWNGSSNNRQDLTTTSPACGRPGEANAGCSRSSTADRLRRVLAYMLDEREFLSPYGIRAISRHHREHPYVLAVNGHDHRVDYEPGESSTGLFGGNSNWRGPIWFPVNYLLIESLQKFHHYFGDDFTVECPTGSGQMMTLWRGGGRDLAPAVAHLPARRRRPTSGASATWRSFQEDPHWRDYVLFYEYFHGDTGARRRRQPSDRLDRTGGQTAAAERRVGLARAPEASNVGRVRQSSRHAAVRP